jgi:hypothetical protein
MCNGQICFSEFCDRSKGIANLAATEMGVCKWGREWEWFVC